MWAPIDEVEIGTSDEITNGLRRQHLAAMCKTCDTSGDVDRDSLSVATGQLDLTRMQSASHFDAERAHCIYDSACTPHGTSRPIEGRHETITERLKFLSTEARQLPSHDGVMLGQKGVPAPVTELGGALGGTHDVREEHRRKNTIGFNVGARSGQEFLRGIRNSIGIPYPDQMIDPRKLNEFSIGALSCRVARRLNAHPCISFAMDNQGRHPYRGKDVADINLAVHPGQRDDRRGACATLWSARNTVSWPRSP